MNNRIARHCSFKAWACLSTGLLAFGVSSVLWAHGFDTPTVQVKPLLKANTTWAGQPLEFSGSESEVQAMEITLSAGGETGWHTHPVASFAYVLEGELEIHLEDGRRHRVSAGQALAEVMELRHNGHNIGAGPVRLVVFYISAPNTTLTQKAEVPEPDKVESR